MNSLNIIKTPQAQHEIADMIHWQLTEQLVECCLLEDWVNQENVKVTTLEDFLTKKVSAKTAFAELPNDYQTALAEISLMVVRVDELTQLLIPVVSGYCSPWRLAKPYFPLLLSILKHNKQKSDDASQAYELNILTSEQDVLPPLLAAADESHALSEDGVAKLKDNLKLAYEGTAWSADAQLPTSVFSAPCWHESLQASECWAAEIDRPFHPIAKAKEGLNAKTYQNYMAEFNQPIYFAWYAVAKTHLMVSDIVSDTDQQNPAKYLLTPDQQIDIQQEMDEKELTATHVAIPVHPWQVDNVLPDMFADDLETGVVVKLSYNEASCFATSSMRSMLLPRDTPHSIKLPMGVYALNSKRYLPGLKLVNGEKNQAILMEAKKADAVLGKHMHLWDERTWWGYMTPEHIHDKSALNPYFYQEKPTQLGAMLRSLPPELCQQNIRLLVMGALGTVVHKDGVSHHLFDDILEQRHQRIDQSSVMACFQELCEVFFDIHLRCLRLGLIPELHGQNVVMVLEDNKFVGVLLRDHDSVRIHLPWLNSHGIEDPVYLSPPNFRNRLYRDKPEELVFYLQTLAILVNVRAVVESVSTHYDMDEKALWQTVRRCIAQLIETIDFSHEQEQLLKTLLFDSSEYPHKTLLLPVIERGSFGYGSMPAGESKTCNPLKRCTS